MAKTLKKGDRIQNICQEGGDNYKKFGMVSGRIDGNKDIEIIYDDGETGRGSNKIGVHYILEVPKEVNFLLRYELEEDPVEEFETLKEVKDRVKELIKNYSSTLKHDRIYVYKIAKKTKIEVDTAITIKGI